MGQRVTQTLYGKLGGDKSGTGTAMSSCACSNEALVPTKSRWYLADPVVAQLLQARGSHCHCPTRSCTLRCVSGCLIGLLALQGIPGTRGLDGVPGKPGLAGETGAPGVAGAAGPSGYPVSADGAPSIDAQHNLLPQGAGILQVQCFWGAPKSTCGKGRKREACARGLEMLASGFSVHGDVVCWGIPASATHAQELRRPPELRQCLAADVDCLFSGTGRSKWI